MRICHISCGHNTEDTRIFFKECVSLANAGYDVTLIQTGGSYTKNGVKIIGFGERSENKKTQLRDDIDKVCRMALGLDADIYHLHESAMLRWVKRFKKKGKTVIFDAHEYTVGGILDKTYIPGPLRKLVSLAYSVYEKNICKKADAIISVTPQIVDYYKTINKNVVLVANYPEFIPDSITPAFSSQKMIYAGGITKQYNVDRIVNTVGKVEGASLILCGPGNRQYIEAMKNSEAWGSVNYLGRIPHAELVQKMSEAIGAYVILTPSNNTFHNEGTLGNTKIFEYMSAGLPVICTDFTLWKEIIDKYECGIAIPYNDDRMLLQATEYLLNNPGKAREMGQKGRIAIEKEYNWKNEEKKLLDLYSVLTSSKSN